MPVVLVDDDEVVPVLWDEDIVTNKEQNKYRMTRWDIFQNLDPKGKIVIDYEESEGEGKQKTKKTIAFATNTFFPYYSILLYQI